MLSVINHWEIPTMEGSTPHLAGWSQWKTALAKTGRNDNSHALLVRMENDSATLENRLVGPQSKFPQTSTISFLGVYSGEIKIYVRRGNVYMEAPGWLSQLTVCFWFRSWSRGPGTKCLQLSFLLSVELLLCLPLPLPCLCMHTLSLIKS